MQRIPGTPGTRLTTPVLVAAVASVGAGLVHAAAAGTHSDDATLAWTFALCAAAQIGWAALVVAAPRRDVLVAGALFNAACVAAWALTRTVGLAGPLADVEPVGTQDLVAALLAAGATAGAIVALTGRLRATGNPRAARPLDVPVVAVCALFVVGMAVPAMASTHSHDGTDHQHAHGHDDGHDEGHDEGAEIAAAGHAHPDAPAGDHAHPGDDTTAGADGPVTSLDDPRLTSAQQARAASLLERTRAAMSAFPDEASIVAAGYTWIGDGRRVGGFQHFVNRSYMGDGRMLDPGHIESFVLQVQPDGSKRVASAMFIAEPGTTMETVPDVGGALTVWHDHQNLCWEGDRIAGILVNGVCRPGGTFRSTQPMIHVWADDPRCGPFTGIEGHGGENCAHSHAPA